LNTAVFTTANEPPNVQKILTDPRRLASTALIVFVATVLVAILHLLYFDPLRRAEHYARDYFAITGRKAPVQPQLVFLAIDKASVQLDQLFPDEIAASRGLELMEQGFPWSREVWALAQERLMQAGARLVVFDLLFPQGAAGDERLRETLERYRQQVVIASDFVFKRVGAGTRASMNLPVSTLIDATEPLDRRIGFDTLWPDADGMIRRVPFVITLRELDNFPPDAQAEQFESLTARSLRQLGRTEAIPEVRLQLFRFAGPPGTFPSRSFYEIFVPKLWSANYANGEFFRDKIVVIGPEGSWSHDAHPTPFRLRGGLMAGPEIHLQALNAALQGEFLRETTAEQELLIFAGAGFVALLIGLMTSAWLRVVAIVAAVAGWAWLALLLFNNAGLFVPVIGPALIGILATAANEVHDYKRERVAKARLRSTFEKYVGEPLVEKLVDDPSSYLNSLGGVRKPVTVLFADVRNFTRMTIERDPAELVEQLNHFFEVMAEPIMNSNGMIDKFMGDSLMAVWGNLRSEGPRTDALAAVRAATAMTEALHQLNKDWRARGWPEFQCGIGIAQGEALVGNIGCCRRMDFTAIGDVTNIAAKLQNLTVDLQCELVISDSVAALVKDDFVLQAAGPVALRGRPFALNIFIVVGPKAKAPQAMELEPQSVTT
jgi:adenylate cyclase